MTVYRNEGKWDTSNVVFRGGRIVRYDKKDHSPDMEYIDYGLGMLKKEALEGIPSDQPYDLAALYQELVCKEQLAGFEVFKRFYEIGTTQGLEETRELLSKLDGGYMEDYSTTHLKEAAKIIPLIDTGKIESMVQLIADVRTQEGRMFFLGVGEARPTPPTQSTISASWPASSAYAPTDNVSELTARTNDEGWETVFVEWLKGSHLSKKDMLFILSVGGGSLEPMVSPNLVRAVQYAKEIGARVVGIVGRDGGYTAKVADAAVIVPTVNPKDGDAAHGGIPRRDLASYRFPPGPPEERHQVGVGTIVGLSEARLLV